MINIHRALLLCTLKGESFNKVETLYHKKLTIVQQTHETMTIQAYEENR